ncbi:DUF2182 domain-containing protein [Roseobacter ponti]|uniref:DUF2182 domain-containing protein n=1 Tax=Roseobacter ponti TaxID=1891787 RepID=A0A858SSX2_9RHOB|nr:DUF2182 domain-containing protein [Roseobacter ponti]QJF51028.1 DUF2182 domain-containing protein [Roseobacter ponti]
MSATATTVSSGRAPVLNPAFAGRLAAPGPRFTLLPALAAWGLLLLLPAANFDLQICATPPATPTAAFGQAWAVSLAGLHPPAALAEWALMVLAMMLPLMVAETGQIAARVYRRSRTGVVLTYLSGYLGAWLLAGPLVILLTLAARAGLQSVAGPAVSPLPALGAGALWMISPLRLRLLARGHYRPVIAAGGHRALKDAARAGAGKAGFCLLTCLPLMVAMQAAGGGPAGMALLTVLLIAERRTARPAPQGSAMVLIFFGFYAVLV